MRILPSNTHASFVNDIVWIGTSSLRGLAARRLLHRSDCSSAIAQTESNEFHFSPRAACNTALQLLSGLPSVIMYTALVLLHFSLESPGRESPSDRWCMALVKASSVDVPPHASSWSIHATASWHVASSANRRPLGFHSWMVELNAIMLNDRRCLRDKGEWLMLCVEGVIVLNRPVQLSVNV